jgi:hypothetical protein
MDDFGGTPIFGTPYIVVTNFTNITRAGRTLDGLSG